MHGCMHVCEYVCMRLRLHANKLTNLKFNQSRCGGITKINLSILTGLTKLLCFGVGFCKIRKGSCLLKIQKAQEYIYNFVN